MITMLEKLDFQSLVEQTVTSKRIPRAMDLYRFVLGIVLGLYIGFPRLNQLRFIARDPILTGILKVTKLPVQSTFWRFVNALHLNVARQILTIMRTMRERVWAAANVKLEVVTIDTDTTVHTLYGQQMGGRKSYNPKNKGKKSYQPMLTFIAETREYIWGELRNGDRPTGKQIGDHIRDVCAALPPCVKQIYGRADSGFYCRQAVEAYEECTARFVISARKTSRLVEQLRQAEWKPSKKTDAGWECEFRYQPDGWKKEYRFVALRYEKTREEVEAEEDRAVPVVRDQPVQVPGLRDRLQRSHLLRGLVLQPARRRGKPDQGGEQRCRAGGAPLRPLRCERQSFPVGDAGLQPELLADAVQPRTAGRRHRATTHDAGDRAAALPVRGRQDLAPRRPHRGELQRSLRGEGRVRAADGSAAPDRAARGRATRRSCCRPCADQDAPPALRAAVHRNLCTACKRNGARNFGAGLGGNGLSGGMVKQRKSN